VADLKRDLAVSPEAGPRRRARIWVERIGFALLLAAVVLGVRYYQQPQPGRRAGAGAAGTAVEWHLLRPYGQFRGPAGAGVLLASWCPVCRLEQGSVSALLRDTRWSP